MFPGKCNTDRGRYVGRDLRRERSIDPFGHLRLFHLFQQLPVTKISNQLSISTMGPYFRKGGNLEKLRGCARRAVYARRWLVLAEAMRRSSPHNSLIRFSRFSDSRRSALVRIRLSMASASTLKRCASSSRTCSRRRSMLPPFKELGCHLLFGRLYPQLELHVLSMYR